MDSKLWHVDCHVMPAHSSYKDITCHSDWRHPIGILVWLTRQQAVLILEGFQSGHRCHTTASVNHVRRNKNIIYYILNIVLANPEEEREEEEDTEVNKASLDYKLRLSAGFTHKSL